MKQKSQSIFMKVGYNIHHFGYSKTLRRIFERLTRPIYSYYLIKRKRYPQNIIFIVAFRKSGSSWLKSMLASLPGFYNMPVWKWRGRIIQNNWIIARDIHDLSPDLFASYNNRLIVDRRHTWAKSGNIEILRKSELKYIITVRDPRDQIISWYWHARRSVDCWDHKSALEKSLSEYITMKLESGEYEREFIDWLRGWLDNRDLEKSLLVRYEDLLEDPFAELKKILAFLGIEYDLERLQNIIDDYAFENVSKRKRGQEDVSQFMRKGIKGEWQHIFTASQNETMVAIGEDVMKKLGYDHTI